MNERVTEQNESRPEEGNGKKPGGLIDIVECVVTVIVVFILLFTFIARQSVVVGSSMNPTLYDGERLVISNLFYTPRYGDIVVIRKQSAIQEPFIKRVIATEGQTVRIDFEEGVVYVDETPLNEKAYTLEPTYIREHFTDEVTVPEGCVFVLGDNRNDSKDSRWSTIGCVDTRFILGKAVLRVLPFSKFGKI